MRRGYIAIWRKIQDHDFYKEPRVFSKYEAWLDILMEAQHDENPQQVIIGMKCFTCHYGECLKSNVTWGRRWGWQEAKVRRFLKLLKNMSQIDHCGVGVTTRIKVINYEAYDPRRRANDEQTTSTRRARDEHATTDKNDKNVKNVYSSPPLPPQKKSCPVSEIVELYHTVLPELTIVPKISAEMARRISARWNAYKDRKALDWWKWYFEGIRKCGFLMGRKKDWAATLHWLTGPENMEKVLSGYYTDRDRSAAAIEEFINE